MEVRNLVLRSSNHVNSQEWIENEGKDVEKQLRNEGSRFFQYLAGICASISMVAWGTHQAWTSPAIPYLTSSNSSFPVSDDQGGWIVSLFYLGDLVGGLVNPLFIDRIGRKYTLMLFALPGLIGWALIISAENYLYLYVARFVAGIGQGSTYNSIVIYLTEISEKNIRGMLVNMIQVSNFLGIFLFTSIAAFTSYEFLNILSTTVIILFLLMCPFLPETPYYYFMKNRNDEAIESLMKLRGVSKPDKLQSEIRQMRLAIEENLKTSAFAELMSKKYNRKCLMIMFFVKMTQLLTGISAISAYAQEIFSSSNLFIKAGVQVMIFNGVPLLASMGTYVVIDRFKRRIIFLSSGLLASILLGSVGLYFFMDLHLQIDVSSINWLPFASLISLQVVYITGLGTIPYILQGELFPMNVKGSAVACGMVMGSIFAFGTSAVYKPLSKAVGVYTTFWFFAIATFLGSLLTFWITPETKGMTLEEIQAMQNPELKEKLKEERTS